MVYREQTIVNRLRRSTNRGKFSRAAWEFVVVLNSRQYEIPEQKLIQIYHNGSIFTQTCAYVGQIESFQWTRKSGILEYIDKIQHCNF